MEGLMIFSKERASPITQEERESRREEVDTASRSVRLEGFILDPDIVALNERYVAGELTSEELTAAIKKAVD
jgi:hypothetical protein